jgi:hypothetical protein
MTDRATIIPSQVLEAKPREREKRRRERESFTGSILGLLDGGAAQWTPAAICSGWISRASKPGSGSKCRPRRPEWTSSI